MSKKPYIPTLQEIEEMKDKIWKENMASDKSPSCGPRQKHSKYVHCKTPSGLEEQLHEGGGH